MNWDYQVPYPVTACNGCTKARKTYCIAITEPKYPWARYGECWARSTAKKWLRDKTEQRGARNNELGEVS